MALRAMNLLTVPRTPRCADIDSRLPEHSARSLKMTKWEYATTPLLIHNTTAILNAWGVDGWELVQVVTGPEGGLVAFFKREVSA
jgi:hypothetical protein